MLLQVETQRIDRVLSLYTKLPMDKVKTDSEKEGITVDEMIYKLYKMKGLEDIYVCLFWDNASRVIGKLK